MTAKEFLNKHFKDSIPSDFNGEIWDERLISAMNQYIRHIAEQAVGVEITKANTWTEEACAKRILNRINELTEAE